MELVEKFVNKYVETAVERHRIFIKKQDGESQPFTNDPILSGYHFCNVFRELDKCSVWMIDKMWELVTLYGAEKPSRIMKAICTWRLVSTQTIFDRWDKEGVDVSDVKEMTESLRRFQKEGLRYNACFIRNTQYKSSQPGRKYCQVWEIPNVLNENCEEVWEKFDGYVSKGEATLQGVTEILKELNVTGKFMAYQYALDWFYYKAATNGTWATDEKVWAQAGPGSLQGMNLLLGRNRHDNLKQEEWLEHAPYVLAKLTDAFVKAFRAEEVDGMPFTLQLVQNWCCEFQKYVKYSGKDNCKKRKYRPFKES